MKPFCRKTTSSIKELFYLRWNESFKDFFGNVIYWIIKLMVFIASDQLYLNHLIICLQSFPKIQQILLSKIVHLQQMAPVKHTVYQCLWFSRSPQSICEEIHEHVNLLLNTKECITAGPLGSDIFLVKNFKKPKEPHQVQYDQKKQSLRCQASTCPRYKSFSVCSHTIAIAFKLNIFPSYIKKAERRNPNQALTNAVNFRKQKDAGKKNLSRPLSGKGQQTAKVKKLWN